VRSGRKTEESRQAAPSDNHEATVPPVVAPPRGQDELHDESLGYEAAWLEEFLEAGAQEPGATKRDK
jgi:hypothetical protein